MTWRRGKKENEWKEVGKTGKGLNSALEVGSRCAVVRGKTHEKWMIY